MARHFHISWYRYLLSPLAWLYGGVVVLRGWLYDKGILRSTLVDLPTIGVGNLSVGGTGKSPMAIYLLQFLRTAKHPALLSRGYRRKTVGYREVELDSLPSEVGDEPLMAKRACPSELVAVCERRVDGCQKIVALHPEVDVVVLDDAYQHRALRLGFSLLLTTYVRPHCHDALLPVGRRRDTLLQAKRANAVVVTGCPATLSEAERTVLSGELGQSGQPVLFTTLQVSGIEPFLPVKLGEDGDSSAQDWAEVQGVFAFAGIANPAPFFAQVEERKRLLGTLVMGDHRLPTARQMAYLERMAREGRTLITTEKDAARLSGCLPSGSWLAKRLWVMRVELGFLGADGECLKSLINGYLESVR